MTRTIGIETGEFGICAVVRIPLTKEVPHRTGELADELESFLPSIFSELRNRREVDPNDPSRTKRVLAFFLPVNLLAEWDTLRRMLILNYICKRLAVRSPAIDLSWSKNPTAFLKCLFAEAS